MEAYILTVKGPEPDGVVVPRTLRLELTPGEADLELPAEPALDEACRASLEAAWASAVVLTQRDDVNGRLHLVGPAPLAGASAGLSLGLLAVGALLDASPRPFFATGGVLGMDGMVAGGVAAQRKADAAAAYAPQLELQDPPFFVPPLAAPPRATGLHIVPVADVGSAYARLDPDNYAKIAPMHRVVRGADGFAGTAGLDLDRAFIAVHGDVQSLPEEVAGIQVGLVRLKGARGVWLHMGEGGLFLWRAFLPRLEAPERQFPALLELARASSVR